MKRKVSIVILIILLTCTFSVSKVFAISSNGGTVNSQMNNNMGSIIDSTTVDGWHSSGGYWTFNFNDWEKSFRVNDSDVPNYFSGTSKTFNQNLVISRALPQSVKNFISIYGKDKVGIKITVGKNGSILNNSVSYTLTDTTIQLNFRPILRYNRYNMWEYHNSSIWNSMTKKVHTPEVTEGYGENYVSVRNGAVGMLLTPSIMRSAYKASDGTLKFTSTDTTSLGNGSTTVAKNEYALNNFFSGGSSGVYFRYPINIEFYDLSVLSYNATISSYEYKDGNTYWVKDGDDFTVSFGGSASNYDDLVKVNGNYLKVEYNGSTGYINSTIKYNENYSNYGTNGSTLDLKSVVANRNGSTLNSVATASLSGNKDITISSFSRLIHFPDSGGERIYKEAWASEKLTVKSDGETPTVSGYPNSTEWNNSDVSFTLSANDQRSGMKSIVLYENGTKAATGTTSINYTATKEGETTYKVVATDNVGNSFTKEFVVKIDKTNPTVTYNPNNKTWTNNSITVNISVDDSLSGVKSWKYAVSTDNGATWGAWVTGTGTNANVTISTEGTSKIKTEVTDNANNIVTVTSGTYQLDKTNPTVTYNPNNKTWTNQDITVNVSVDDNLSGVKSWKYAVSTDNGATWGAWVTGTGTSDNVTISTEGTSKIKTEVTDNANNTVTVTSGSYQLDKTNPTVTYNPNGKPWTNQDITVNVSVDDNLSGVKSWKYAVSTDNGATWGAWVTGTGTSDNVTISTEGISKIKTEVTDNSGNTDTVISNPYYLDKTAPDGDVKYNYDDVTSNLDIIVSDVVENGSGVDRVWVEYWDKENPDKVLEKELDSKDKIYTGKLDLYEDFEGKADNIVVEIWAIDKAGNSQKLDGTEIDIFGVSATIERVLKPHTPNFKEGEKGILKITLTGGVNKVKIIFPTELSQLDETLDREIILTPKKYETIDYEFFIPLDTPSKSYKVKVIGYKNEKEKEVYPSFQVQGSILDQIRTRIRIR